MRQISRDPFARSTLLRYVAECSDTETCTTCGAVRVKNKAGRLQPLYQYMNHSDGMNSAPLRAPSWIKGKFCSIGCWRQYHGDF